MQDTLTESTRSPSRKVIRIVGFILVSLFIFLFAIDLMVGTLQLLGSSTRDQLLDAIANPFAGLFAGLLVTAIIQSSSTTTAVVVTFVAAGNLSLSAAVPIIMGANIGTTITATIVSLGFLGRKKEFKRAVAGGTYHCFFNVLTTIVLFPLEYHYNFLSQVSLSIGEFLGDPSIVVGSQPRATFFGGLTTSVSEWVGHPIVVGAVAFALLFFSILFFRKLISDLLEARSPESFNRFFFKGEGRSFFWGVVTTAVIRSSTITTSLIVPVVAKKVVTLRDAAPFVMGANVGTTITAFIAAMWNPNATVISIAVAHFLFNTIGVLLFFPVPALKEIPIHLAKSLGELTYRNRLAGFVFILLTFFIVPFGLIYLSRV